MRKFFLLAGLFLFGFINSFAQAPSPTPAPTPIKPSRAAMPIDLRATTNPGFVPDGLELRQMILQIVVQPLYRKPTKQELKIIAPASVLRQRYADFLAQDDTGLVRLVFDYGCADNTNIVTATETCLRFSMPGAGNSYSFRANTYRIRRLADLTFSGANFHVTGILTHGIMVNIGDVPLENVTLQTNGTKFINEFKPASDLEKALELDKQLVKGIERDGFFYSRALTVEENKTYVLRSIAYNGKILRAAKGITYNELDFDKRKDVTVAFRVVSRDGDGSVTILWKELSRKDAPKIKKKLVEDTKQIKPSKLVAKN
jgi:hypothetical protein